jgi:glycosyltransferase involved in cell wall biosynthesis
LKKILFILGFLSQYGGLENEFTAFANLATKNGFSVTAYTPNKVQADSIAKQQLAKLCTFESAQEYWRRCISGKAFYIASLIKYLARRRQWPSPSEEIFLAQRPAKKYIIKDFWHLHGLKIIKNCDIVHLFGKPSKFVVDGAKIAYAVGKPIVYSTVSAMDEKYSRSHPDFVDSSNICNVITVCSTQKAKNVTHYFNYRNDIRVIEQWAYLTEDKLLGLPIDTISRCENVTIGTVSRLDRGKGIDTLLYAFSKLIQNRTINARLKIAGDGEYEGQLRKIMEEMNLAACVEFVGHIPTEAIHSFYGSLDIFIMPSEWEGGPVTGVEAMAAGLPIISTPVGAMPERLRHGEDGLFVEAKSVNELEQAIRHLIFDKDLRLKMKQSARKRYLDINHSKVNAIKLLDIWNMWPGDG